MRIFIPPKIYIYTNVCKMSSILFRLLCVKNIVLIPKWWPIFIFIEAELWLAILVLTATCVAPQKCCRHSGDRRPTSSSCPAYCAPSCHDGHPNCWPLDLAWNPPPVASSGTSSMTRGRSSRSQDFFLDSLMVRTVETLYNTINFCWSTHKRHSIARPKGRGMGCLLWVQRATYCVDLSIFSSIKYSCYKGSPL